MMTREDIVKKILNNNLGYASKLTETKINRCLDQWEQPHRYYHGLKHLVRLMEEINGLNELVWPTVRREKMEILALFHDVVYDPRKQNNEEESIKFVKTLNLVEEPLNEIFDAIRWTQYKKDQDFMDLGANSFIRMFCSMDIGLECMDYEGDNLANVMHREIQCFKEYQHCDFPAYKTERLAFIQEFKYFSGAFKNQATNFLNNYRPKIGVYPGSFAPFHIGHMNILEQAEKIFDKVIIAVGKNPEKIEDGKPWPGKVLPFHEVVSYHGLLSEYLETVNKYADVTVIRGLRSGYDLDYEMSQLRILEDCNCHLPVAYFLCSKETTHISGSMIRGMAKFGDNVVEKYMPKKYLYNP